VKQKDKNRRKRAAPYVEKLAAAIIETETASDPLRDLSIMFTDEHRRLFEDVIYPAIVRGCNYRGIVAKSVKISPEQTNKEGQTEEVEEKRLNAEVPTVSEKRVNEIYFSIKRHLNNISWEKNSWNKTVYHRFQPETIKDVIRTILSRFEYSKYNQVWVQASDYFDWAVEFERLHDCREIAEFLDELRFDRKIPPDDEKVAKQYALKELDERAKILGLMTVDRNEFEAFQVWKAEMRKEAAVSAV
jgi:hypothetical protein